MKKIVFTIAALAAFSFANAQEIKQPVEAPNKKATTEKKEVTTKKQAESTELHSTKSTNKGGSTKKDAVVAEESTTAEPMDKKSSNENGSVTDPKKSGTRMAINEKGLPGEKKSTKNKKVNTPK